MVSAVYCSGRYLIKYQTNNEGILFRCDDELSRFSINLNIIKKITVASAKLVKIP